MPGKMIACLPMLLLFSTAALAGEYRLGFNDGIFGGQRTLDLAKALRKQHRVDADKLEINRIEVVAKSQQGGGLAWIGSRYSQTNRQTVPGNAMLYDNPAAWTFGHLTFMAQGLGSDLKLNLNGQIKLREVIVHAHKTTDKETLVKDHQGNARLVLPMGHQTLLGQNAINIKQLLRTKTKINPDRYNLKGIEVSAKSRNGSGQVWLESGRQASRKQVLSGSPRTFNARDRQTYDRKFIKSPVVANQKPPWRVHFNGDIRLNELVINLAPR